MRVLVTGASGFIGTNLTRHLLDQGYDVIASVRSSASISFNHPHLTWRVGDIRDQAYTKACVANADMVVHLAALKADEPDSYTVNVKGTKYLLNACREHAVRGIIHVSTLSTKLARPGAYGSTKLEAEEKVRASGIPAIILRPSVVYDAFKAGIVGSIINYTALPIIPVIGNGAATFRPLHVEDAAVAIRKILERRLPDRCVEYDLGGPSVLSFNEMVRIVSHKVHHKSPIIVHIPVPVAFLLAYVLQTLMKRPPITVSNVIAATENIEVNAEPFFREYDFFPRSFEQGLRDSMHTSKTSTEEAQALLTYVMPMANITELHLKQYAAAIRIYGLYDHRIDQFLLARRWRLGGFDAITRFTRRSGAFQRKLLIAAAIVECSPLSAEWLLPRERGRVRFAFDSMKYAFSAVGKLACGVALISIPHLLRDNA